MATNTPRASVSPFHSLVTRCSSLSFSPCPLRARGRNTPQCAGPIMPREAREKAGRAASTGILHVCLISGAALLAFPTTREAHSPGRCTQQRVEAGNKAEEEQGSREFIGNAEKGMKGKGEREDKCRATQVEHSSHGDAQRSGIARAARFVPPLLASRMRLALVPLSRVRTGMRTTP